MSLNYNYIKTKKTLFVSLLILFNAFLSSISCYSQSWQDVPVYTDIKEAMKSPNSVKRIDLSKQKLTKIPTEVFTEFPNLYELVLSKNKINKIPLEIGDLKNLRILKLDRNKIDELPETIGKLNKLEVLDVNRTDLYRLPEAIGECSSLEHIIAWDTNLFTLPRSLRKCSQLKMVNLRNIEFSDAAKEELKAMLPGVIIEFTESCNCGPNP